MIEGLLNRLLFVCSFMFVVLVGLHTGASRYHSIFKVIPCGPRKILPQGSHQIQKRKRELLSRLSRNTDV